MHVIIDRFENGFAVVELEDGKFADMPAALVPGGAREGDVICISIDTDTTDRRKENIKSLMDELWND